VRRKLYNEAFRDFNPSPYSLNVIDEEACFDFTLYGLTTYHYGGHKNGDSTGKICSTNWRDEKCI
jgi:hypothetical protein